jgi:hypothetical protein
MGIDRYPELADLLLGRGAAERPGAPEPTLLPHLAPFAGTEALEWLCDSADLYASGRSGLPPWPDLSNAVFATIAPRLGQGTLATRLLDRFPGLASFLPGEWLADALLKADSARYPENRAQLLVRLAARFPQHGNGALRDAARDAIVNHGGWERSSLFGWFGVAVDASERSAVLEEMLADDSIEPASAGVLLPLLQAADQERLALHLARSGGSDAAFVACQLLHVLPFSAPEVRGAMLEIIRPGLLDPQAWRPGWYSGLITARLNLAGETGLAQEYAGFRDELEPAWRAHLLELATMSLGDFPFRDVLYAHPGAATVLLERVSLEGLASEVSDLLDQMIGNWGGSGPPEELAPPEPAPPPAPQTRGLPMSKSRGLAGRVASMGRRIRRAMRGPPADTAPPPPRGDPPEPAKAPRFLQVDVFLSEDGALTRRTRSFERDRSHEIQVLYAPPDAGRIQLDEALPDHLLPPEEEKHELTVLLVADALFDGVLSQTIELPKTGPSEVAKFSVRVPGDVDAVELMVIVLHRGTHIQSGYLNGPATEGEHDPRASGFVFRKGQMSAADRDHGDRPELTFYKDGRQLVIHRQGHPDRTPSMAGMDKRMGKIRDALFDGAHGVYQLDSGLSSGPGLKLLRLLAAQGEYMRRKLFGDDTLDEVRRLQVVSPYSADFFPVEYLYDRHPPDPDAELCPTFASSTGAGNTCEGCTAPDDGSIVCPLGFWGLNRVIERQVRPIDLDGDSPPEPSRERDLLPAVNGVVLAASNHVNDEDPDEVSDTLAALNEITGTRSYLAQDWEQWQQLTREHHPVLLVALPHNVDNDLGFQALQISADQELALNEIGTEYRPPAESVILLLGCNTAAAAVEYEDFIAGLRSAGASVVVGTITYVLGMQAAPLAREFVRQFWSHSSTESIPMGELVRAVRTRMVRDGNPLALAITAYGGADWRLTPRGEV